MRRLEARIHDPGPRFLQTVEDGEGEWLRVSIDHDVKIEILLGFAAEIVGQTPRGKGHVSGWANAAPADLFPPKFAAADGRMSLPKGDHEFNETENVGMLVKSVPIEPSCFVVLVIRVIVPSLSV